MTTVTGGAGDDILIDDPSATGFDGQDGRDRVDFSASDHAVIADLSARHAYKAPRILAFGDSITHGVVANVEPQDTESGGYRRFLLETLAQLDASVDMVGSLANGPGTMVDRDHEGHRGWTLNQLDAIDAGVLSAARPDAVLLMAGTNDSFADTSGTMVKDLRALLLSITTAAPEATVFIASLPPVVVGQQSQTRANRVDAYNDAMPALIAELAGQGRKVVFVDMRGLTTDDVTHPPADSGLHPTLAGYEKIAAYWTGALQAAYGLRPGAIGLDQDQLTAIEDLTGSGFDDRLTGDQNANAMDGLAGDDRLDGQGGADVLRGGDGADTFVVKAGYGVLVVEDFQPTDRIEAHGFSGWTSVEDVADGARIVLSPTDSIVLEGLTAAQVAAGQFVWMDPPQEPQPPAGAIVGTAGADVIPGTTGADVIWSLAGDDRLDGQGGDDVLRGGDGADTFVFKAGYGALVIEDLQATDRIEVRGFEGWTSLQDVADGVRVVLSATDAILLKGLTAAQVTADRFIFDAPQEPQPPAGAIVGTAGADALVGTSGADAIWGLEGADTLDGKAGGDTLVGGAGDDAYTVDHLADQVTEKAGGGTDAVNAYLSWTLSPHVEILYLRGSAGLNGTGADGDETLYGNSAANILKGMAGDDVLDGRGGADRLDGGAGDDRLIGGTGADVFVYRDGGHDVIDDLASSEIIEVHGYGAWQSLQQVGSDVLVTFSADDTLLLKGRTVPSLSTAIFHWMDPPQEPQPPAGAITGTSQADVIPGTTGADVIWSLAGDDRLDGQGGADVLRGGDGADTFVVKAGYGVLVVEDFQPTDRIEAHGFSGWTSVEDVADGARIVLSPTDSIVLEGLTAAQVAAGQFVWMDPPQEPQPPAGAIVGTAGADVIPGTTGADVIWSLAGDDRLDGQGGDDVLRGGDGADTFVFKAGYGALVIEDLQATDRIEVRGFEGWTSLQDVADGVRVVLSATDAILLKGLTAAQVTADRFIFDAPQEPQPPAGAIVGTAGADALVGTSGADAIWGLEGADTLDGKAGGDTLVGGAGDDAYTVDHLADQVTEKAGGGTDAVNAYLSWTLSPHVEILYLRGSAGLNGTGADGDETLYGNSAANILKGMAGDDVLDGRGGADRLDGGAGDDRLIGGTGADVFVYRDGGHDVIDDLASSEIIEVHGYGAWQSLQQVGSDVLVTFSADDTLLLKGRTVPSLSTATFHWMNPPQEPQPAPDDPVPEPDPEPDNPPPSDPEPNDPAPGASGPPAGAIVGTAGADALVGTSGADVIWGLEGADTLDGKAGGDTLVGGAGDDAYTVDHLADQVTEEAGGGTDAVNAYVSWTLSPHVEILYLRGSAGLSGTGADGDETLYGNSAANLLEGMAGDDVLDGRGGADRLDGGAGDDRLIGGTDADVFVYRDGGHDVIDDLASSEIIEVHGYGAWQSLQQVGSDVLVTFSADDTLRLVGANAQTVGAQITFL